jgi:hypothetical protein
MPRRAVRKRRVTSKPAPFRPTIGRPRARSAARACVRGRPPEKIAVSVCEEVNATVQAGLGPVQAPLHPTKLCPASGAAVRETLVPAS